MQFEKLLKDDDKLWLVLFSSIFMDPTVVFEGTWKDFNISFTEMGWTRALPKGYDNDDLKWYIEEVILKPKNPYGCHVFKQPLVTLGDNNIFPSNYTFYKRFWLYVERG